MREVEEDIRRGEEREGSNLDGEGDGDEPRCALKTEASLGGEQGGGLSLKYGGRGVLPPFLRHGRVLMRPRLITSKVDHLY